MTERDRKCRNENSIQCEESSCNSDDSYIYGKNLSLGLATDSNTVSRSMHINSLQYAKVNKARKTRWDVQTDGDLENKIESLQPPSKIDDFDMDKLDGKDLT